MIQGHRCVSAHCDQCGDSLGGLEFEAHYPTEDAALDAAIAEGWRVGPGGRWYCSTCGPVLTCEAQGHEFTPWRVVLPGEDELGQLAGAEQLARVSRPVNRENPYYRYCLRCCLHETHRDPVLTAASTNPTDLDRWVKDALDAELTRMDAAVDFEAGLADVYARAGLTRPGTPQPYGEVGADPGMDVMPSSGARGVGEVA